LRKARPTGNSTFKFIFARETTDHNCCKVGSLGGDFVRHYAYRLRSNHRGRGFAGVYKRLFGRRLRADAERQPLYWPGGPVLFYV
jgi:hypothetical protein